jgi:hypothetical protein
VGWLVGVSVLLAASASAWLLLSPAPLTDADHFTSIAMSYAVGNMVWSSGPTVQSSEIVPLARLQTALTSRVPRSVSSQVNVPDLTHQYGPSRKVALVVLHGVYNSLPPDEGVNIRGDVVLLVDVRTGRVLFMTA